MSETTVIALVILVGVFTIMVVAIIKGGHEAAIKMWGVMGALTGVAFGSITSYYFTKEDYEEQLVKYSRENSALTAALESAAHRAQDVEKNLNGFKSALAGEIWGTDVKLRPVALKISNAIPASDKEILMSKISADTEILKLIQEVGFDPKNTNKIESSYFYTDLIKMD